MLQIQSMNINKMALMMAQQQQQPMPMHQQIMGQQSYQQSYPQSYPQYQTPQPGRPLPPPQQPYGAPQAWGQPMRPYYAAGPQQLQVESAAQHGSVF